MRARALTAALLAASLLFAGCDTLDLPDADEETSGAPTVQLDNSVRSVQEVTCTQKIAYTSDAETNSNDLSVMDADGSNKSRITTTKNAFESDPSWSSDGTNIVFEKIDFDTPSSDDIYVIGADGSNLTRLTTNPEFDGDPTWSPDGSKIAFRTDRDNNFEIYSINADGSNPTRLTNNEAVDSGPAWSPDGSKIAFTSQRDGNPEIWVMNADGSNPIQLTNTPADALPIRVANVDAAWSPDGSKIAFATTRDGNTEIYVMDADGSNPTRLTNNSASDRSPSWSPDGSKIAFSSDRDSESETNGNREIYVMNADGSNITRLTNNSAFDDEPAFGCVVNTVEVKLDIKPGSHPNAINPNSKGNIPVAILHTDEFNPIDRVDVGTLRFGDPEDMNGGGAEPAHNGHVEDVDNDGDDDLVLHFPTQDAGFEGDETEGKLTGETNDDTSLFGTDSVILVGGGPGGGPN